MWVWVCMREYAFCIVSVLKKEAPSCRERSEHTLAIGEAVSPAELGHRDVFLIAYSLPRVGHKVRLRIIMH